MPKPFSRRLDAALAAYKGSKPKNFLGVKAFNFMDPLHTMHGGKSGEPQQSEVAPTVSGYNGVDSASFNGPFGSGTSKFGAPDASGHRSIDTSMQLSAPLKQAGDTASTGLSDNLGYLQRDPTEQVNHLTSGGDPLYNIINEQSQRAYDQNLGRMRVNAQQAGGSNSTAAGAAYGKLMTDKGLTDNQNLYTALDYGNQTARANANTNLGAIGGLSQLVYPLGSAANAQLNTATHSNDIAQAATAAAQNNSNSAYTAALNQYNANQQAGNASGIGSLIGTVGGAVIGGPAGAQIGGAIGGQLSGGSAPQYSAPQYSQPYVPQTFGLPAQTNFGNVSGYGSRSPLFTDLSSPVY